MSKNMTEEESRKEKIIEQNYFQEKTRFEIIEEKVKKTLFSVLNILLKFEDDDFSDEVIDLLNETCQFLFYDFYEPMGYLWKNDPWYNSFSTFLSYFQTTVFFNNTELYTVFFYILMGVVLFVVIDAGYVAYILSSKNKSGAVWPMILLRSVVSYVVTVLFDPMVEYFLAILECSENDEVGNFLGYYQNYNIDDMHCWTNVHFTVMCIEGVLISIIFIIVSAIVMSIFYEQKTSMDKEEAKTSSHTDIVTLFVKIILILIYSFLVWTKSYHWIVVPGTTLSCFILFYSYWTERPFYEEKTNYAFFLHTGIVFYSTVVLLLLKILATTPFDGGIYILLIGGFMISYIILTQKDDRFKLLLCNINKFSDGDSVFKQIRYLLELVDKSHEDRKSNILLKGYIYVHEENCTNSECPLKRYLQETEKSEKTSKNLGTTTETDIAPAKHSTVNNYNTTTMVVECENGENAKENNNGNDADLYLYQYVMNMYQNGISKFSLCTSLRMNFSFFLMERMNNTKKALIELKNCEKYNPSFEEEFIIFRYCENNAGQENDDEGDDDDEEGLDIVASIAYKNHFNTFKEGLTNITSIYYDFWSLLLNNVQKSDEDIAKMNEYGEKLNKLLEVVKGHYAEMEKIKYNDEEVLKLYSDFFADILNAKSQADYYRGRLRDIQVDGGQEVFNSNDPADTSNENIDYIFLTAEGSQIGKIVKCSPNFCSLLGYTPDELIGKNIDFIMPEIFHSAHDKLLNEKASRFKTQMAQNVRSGETGNQKAIFKELFVIAKNKLNNAVPLLLKVTLIYEHELNELFFIGRLNNQELYENFNLRNPSPNTPAIINFNMKVCYVLTNTDFIVQYYTLNANTFLGFKVGSNGNIDIIKNITEYGNNDDGLDNKKLSKGEILIRRYAEPKIIIWKTLLTEENDPNNKQNINIDTAHKWDMKGFWLFSKEITKKKEETIQLEQVTAKKASLAMMPFMQFKRQRFKEDYFYLTVTQSKIRGNILGYIFKFEICDMDENDINSFDEKNEDIKKKESIIAIDSSYVPIVTKKFALDTKKFGFYAQDNNDDYQESENSECSDYYDNLKNWHEKLRDLAKEKINKFKQKQKDLENEEEEEEEEDSEENEEEENSNENSNIFKYQSTLTKQNTANQSHLEESSEGNTPLSKANSLLSKQESFNFKNTFSKKEIEEFKNSEKKNNNSNHIVNNAFGNNGNFLSHLNNNVLNNNNNNLNNNLNNNVQPVEKVNYEFDYYHIKGINSIKFLIYDYKKGRLVDVPKIKRESQVEYKKKEGIPNFLGGKFKERKDDKSDKNSEEEDDTVNESAEVKRIEYALQKEQFQPEIVKLKWFSLGIYVAVMGITVILLIFIINNVKDINEIILMINNSRLLQTDLLYGFYYIRELTLLARYDEHNLTNYNTSLYNKDYMLKNISTTLNELFDRSSIIERKLVTTTIKWSKDLSNILTSKKTLINIINDKLDVIGIETQVFSAITELLGNLFEIVNTSLEKVIQTDINVHFYTTNLINPILSLLHEYMDNLLYQLSDTIIKYKNKFLLIIIFSIIILIIGGVIIKIILDKISRRKSGYLEVFFQIEKKVCKKALDKCDEYAKVLNPSSGDEEESVDSENNFIAKKNEKEEKDKEIEYRKVQNKRKPKKCINIREAFNISFILLIVFICYLIIIILFQQNLDTMENYSNLYNITSAESIKYQKLFDVLREYFFDSKSYTGKESYKDILNIELSSIYEFQKERNENFDLDKLPSKLKKKYLEVTLNDLCFYAGDLFSNSVPERNKSHILDKKYQCYNLTENSTIYGLNLLLSYYLEEIRTQKNYFDQIYGNNSNYNNTLYGSEFENISYSNITEEYNKMDPFNIFNNEHVFQLSMIRRYFLLPIYNNTLNVFYDSIKGFWDTSYEIFLIVMILFLILVTAFYLAYWIPSIYSMDEDIYKTKNMLSIIPKDVLTTIPGINKLLNLGNVQLFSGNDDKKKKKAIDVDK